MGVIISANNEAVLKEQMRSRLLIYYKKIYSSVCDQTIAISVGKPLSEKLLKVRPRLRSLRLAECFWSVLNELPENVVIKDIDVMFNPEYQVDVLQILTEVWKKKHYQLIWPGEFAEDRLIYSEEGYPDYHSYNIGSYNLAFIIGRK